MELVGMIPGRDVVEESSCAEYRGLTDHLAVVL
jgi:hypothetical protein